MRATFFHLTNRVSTDEVSGRNSSPHLFYQPHPEPNLHLALKPHVIHVNWHFSPATLGSLCFNFSDLLALFSSYFLPIQKGNLQVVQTSRSDLQQN